MVKVGDRYDLTTVTGINAALQDKSLSYAASTRLIELRNTLQKRAELAAAPRPPEADLWERVKESLRATFTAKAYSYLASSVYLGKDAQGTHIIGVRNDFARDFLNHKHGRDIQKAIKVEFAGDDSFFKIEVSALAAGEGIPPELADVMVEG